MENWKTVVCNGVTFSDYEISDLGDLRYSKDLSIKKVRTRKDGYQDVSIGMRKIPLIHRLVAEAFLDNPNNLNQVIHLNGDKSDNRLENLKYACAKTNGSSKFKHGSRIRLNENQVLALSTLLSQPTKLVADEGVGRKKVMVIFEGKVINTFSSCTDVARIIAGFIGRETEQVRKSISKCCLNNIDKAYGLSFQYA